MLRYQRPLLQYAASLTSSRETARDLVQDTFLRLANHGPVEEERLASWLFTVCRNRAHDIRRKERRFMPPSHLPTEMISPEPGPDLQLQANELHARLLQLLTHLPESQREVVRLRFQGGLSYKEIAEVTQLGVSHVGVLLHQALKRLRQLWQQTLEVDSL